MSKISQIKVTLQKLLTEFESIATDKGNLEFVGGLAVGGDILRTCVRMPLGGDDGTGLRRRVVAGRIRAVNDPEDR